MRLVVLFYKLASTISPLRMLLENWNITCASSAAERALSRRPERGFYYPFVRRAALARASLVKLKLAEPWFLRGCIPQLAEVFLMPVLAIVTWGAGGLCRRYSECGCYRLGYRTSRCNDSCRSWSRFSRYVGGCQRRRPQLVFRIFVRNSISTRMLRKSKLPIYFVLSSVIVLYTRRSSIR